MPREMALLAVSFWMQDALNADIHLHVHLDPGNYLFLVGLKFITEVVSE